jgi:hypothetical protein
MNRIHQPKTSRFAKNVNVKPKKAIENPKPSPVNAMNIVPPQSSKRALNIIDLNLNNLNQNHDNFLHFKSIVEEDISYLKDQLNKTNEISIENKNGINQALELIQRLNEQITNYTDQAEEYKQITNERIEKLVKLFLLVNNKLSTLSNLNL